MKFCLLGGCSFSYLYILFTSLLLLLKSSILSLNLLSVETYKNIFGIEPVLLNHGLMKLLIEYIGYIIYGYIFLYVFRRNKIFKKKDEIENRTNNNQLIYDNKKKKLSFRAIKLMLIACCLFAIQLIIRNIMSILNLWMLDLWIFNIIFIQIFMKKFFNTIIYKHQLYSLIFNFAINLILLIVASSIKFNKIQSDYDIIKDKFGNYIYIGLFYLVFFALAAIISLSQVLQKHLMDFDYISPFQIIFIIGIFSTFFTLITLIITTKVKCNENLIQKELCPSVGDNNDHYFDSFIIFGNNLKEQFKKYKSHFFIEIFLVYPLYSLACYSKYFFETMIVYHLNPNYVLISDTIYYSILKIISLIGKPNDLKTYLKLFGEIIALFGYFIYLEIIQFGCCEMNFNTKISIRERSRTESIGINDEDDDEDDDENNDANNNNNNNKKDYLIKKENEMVTMEVNDNDK